MLSIFRKEINLFFSSLIGYIVVGVFLVILGLFLFVFPDTSILNYGFASLDPLFSMAPNIFVFLIPAITMRTFAEEQQSGTIELLLTRPISDWQIIGGKYFASLALVVFALLPTVLYYYTVYQLGAPVGNLDSGGILGSYIGLLFLAAGFVAIGVFASAVTQNQIVAFLLATAICFWFFWGFDYFSRLPIFVGKGDDWVQMMGMLYHYDSLSRGVLDSRDVVYFLSLTGLFWFLSMLALERRKW
ncbi:MAG: gliding motility-associated ABC transporter permease subunit GldF [Bacteroidetes bacterium]|nr:MAG: gliding motility-associated ABC transporter permease subunit GldF [Bacteroidota bacterium]PTM08721.1 MAG: gliding motility-associated ABC transporter permease subunit GldF [Bacteroidota bacterium]